MYTVIIVRKQPSGDVPPKMPSYFSEDCKLLQKSAIVSTAPCGTTLSLYRFSIDECSLNMLRLSGAPFRLEVPEYVTIVDSLGRSSIFDLFKDWNGDE